MQVDSSVKTVYGSPEGRAKGNNPHRWGALSYNLLLSFCPETMEILRAGCIPAAPIPSTGSSSLPSNFWLSYRMIIAWLFAPAAAYSSVR